MLTQTDKENLVDIIFNQVMDNISFRGLVDDYTQLKRHQLNSMPDEELERALTTLGLGDLVKVFFP